MLQTWTQASGSRVRPTEPGTAPSPRIQIQGQAHKTRHRSPPPWIQTQGPTIEQGTVPPTTESGSRVRPRYPSRHNVRHRTTPQLDPGPGPDPDPKLDPDPDPESDPDSDSDSDPVKLIPRHRGLGGTRFQPRNLSGTRFHPRNLAASTTTAAVAGGGVTLPVGQAPADQGEGEGGRVGLATPPAARAAVAAAKGAQRVDLLSVKVDAAGVDAGSTGLAKGPVRYGHGRLLGVRGVGAGARTIFRVWGVGVGGGC